MSSRIDWKEVHSKFPVNRECIWLNNGGTTPASDYVLEAVASYMEEYSRKSVLTEQISIGKTKESICRILSELFKCRPEDIALIHNTSEGLNLVSLGMDLHSGDEILLLENEYPSNVYPWEHWQDKGVSLSFLPMSLSQEEFYENAKGKISGRTRVISVSAVHWCTGMPLPVRELAELCRERGIFLVVDAAQGAGHVSLDIGWGIDFMAFSAWKWLLGPVGMGILIVPREKLSSLKPVFKGTESVINDKEYLPYKRELKPNAGRYMYSTGSYLDWVYFDASLKFLSSLGFDTVKERIYELAEYLSNRLREVGFKVLSDSFDERRTGIVVASREEVDSRRLVKELLDRNIVVKERLGRIRFSPHIYNSFEQLDRTAEEIKSLIA